MRAASYRTDGMHAGRVVEHRQVQGPQLWIVVVSVERERLNGRARNGLRDTHHPAR